MPSWRRSSGRTAAAGNARESIRERISLKQTTITLEEAKKQEREEEKEVVIKSNVISVKDEIQQPKFLGKIDLSPKPKAAPAPAAEGGSGKTRRTASCGPRSTRQPARGAQGCRTTRTGHACNPGSPAVTGSPCHTGKPRRTRNAGACGACCSGCPGCAR